MLSWNFFHSSVNELESIRAAIQADRSPERIRITPVTVANGRTIRLAAVGISNTGEAFANSSSLYLRWQLSSCDGLAHWDDTDDPKGTKYGWERFLRLQNESGLVLPKVLICLCAIICIEYLLEILSMPFCALSFGSKILLKNCSYVNQFVSVA